MEEAGTWSTWVQGIPAALIAAAAWTCILALGAPLIMELRKPYLVGLVAAAVAYAIAVSATTALVVVFPSVPVWLTFVVLPPIIEETARLVGARQLRLRSKWSIWLAFGIGYGLLEAGLKLGDLLVVLARNESADASRWVAAFAPIVPLLLHVFLSMFVFLLLQKGVRPLVIFGAAAAVHAVNNWSALALLPTTIPQLALTIIVRSALLLVLIFAVAKLSRTRSAETAGVMP